MHVDGNRRVDYVRWGVAVEVILLRLAVLEGYRPFRHQLRYPDAHSSLELALDGQRIHGSAAVDRNIGVARGVCYISHRTASKPGVGAAAAFGSPLEREAVVTLARPTSRILAWPRVVTKMLAVAMDSRPRLPKPSDIGG